MTSSDGRARHSAGPFRLSPKEYVASAGTAKYSRLTKIYGCVASALVTMLIQIVMWGIFILILRTVIGRISEPVVVSAVILAGALALFLMLRVINPAIMQGQFRGLAASRQDYTISLHDDGVHYSCGSIACLVPWNAVDRVIDKRGCIFLFIDDVMAVITPRRVFASTSDADGFLNFAQHRWKMTHV